MAERLTKTSTTGHRKLRLLVIAAHFAPSGAVGAKRFSYLASEFARLGHEVETITLSLPGGQRVDSTLPIAGKVSVVRSLLPIGLPRRGLASRAYDRLTKTIFGFPDHYSTWLLPCVLAGLRAIRCARPNVIVATSPPYTSLVAGAILAQCAQIPLVIDYRDPWTAFDWPATPRTLRRTSPVRRRIEWWVLRAATGAVFSSELMRRQFEAHYTGSGAPQRMVITNGYLPISVRPADSLDPRKLRVVYAGNFYGERRLSTVIAAIGQLESSGTPAPRVEVHIYGQVDAGDWQQTVATGLADRVQLHPSVTHREILDVIAQADVLLIVSGGDMSYSYPYKLFDYLSVRQPILAISPSGSALAEFMQSNDCGELAIADDPNEIAQALSRLLARRGEYSYRGCDGFTWDQLALRYDELLQAVAAPSAQSPNF